MSRDENPRDQPGLWDEFTESQPAPRRSRGRPSLPSAAPDTPAPPVATTPNERDHLWSVADVATFLGVPKKTIYSWRTTGKGPKGFRVGKHLRWHPRTVLERSLRLEEEQ
jgi:predicted DNA-binding transcriptional regulator AlpA